MGSIYMTPVVMLMFSVSGLVWLVILGMFGWAWGIRGRALWTIVPVSMIQGLFGGQLLVGFWLIMFNPLFPESFLPWLRLPALILYNLALLPALVSLHFIPQVTPDTFAAMPFYALAFFMINLAIVVAGRLPRRRRALAR